MLHTITVNGINGVTYKEGANELLRRYPGRTWKYYRDYIHGWWRKGKVSKIGSVLVNGGKTVADVFDADTILRLIDGYNPGSDQPKDGNLNYIVRMSSTTAEWLKAQEGIVSVEKQSHATASHAPELDE